MDDPCITDAKVLTIIAGSVSDDELSNILEHTTRCRRCRDRLESVTQTLPEHTPETLSPDGLRGLSYDVPQIPGYAEIHPIGLGGLGTVFRAIESAIGRQVALKIARPRLQGASDALRREIRLLEVLRHPGIIQMFGHGLHDRRPFISMELIGGSNLEDRFQKGSSNRLDKEMLTILLRLSGTLAYLHGEGIVHRDLSPRNILLRGPDTPVLIDFGLAHHFAGRSGRDTLEVGGAVAGTIQYMSPEQIRGELTDARADLYSLGCIIYQAVTGRPPFLAANYRELIRQHLNHRPPAPSEHAPVEPSLERLILHLLEKNPTRRLGYAQEVYSYLASLGATPWEHTPSASLHDYVYRASFVGRREVMDDLLLTADQCLAGQTSIALIGGESGVGKTRLLSEVATALHRRGFCVVSGATAHARRSVSTSEGSALTALQGLFAELVSRCDSDPDRMKRLLDKRGAVLSHHVPMLSDLHYPAAPPSPDSISGEAAVARLIYYARQTLLAMASWHEPPLALVLDDFHWADFITRAVICRLGSAESAGNARLLILASYRSEEANPAFRRELGLLESAARHTLPRLGAKETARVVGGMLAIEDLPEALTAYIYQNTRGNPFFVGQYVRALVESAWLRRTDSASWTLVPQDSSLPSEAPLPSSAAEVILHRLAHLSIQGRELLDLTSLLGSCVPTNLLLQVASRSDSVSALSNLQELWARRILVQDGEKTRFAHDKIWETALAAIGAENRRRLHALAASVMTHLPRAATAAWHSELGRHWLGAGDALKAIEYYENAGNQAFCTADYRMAVRCFESAIACAQGENLDSFKERRGRWEYFLGEALYCSGDSDRSSQHLIRSVEAHGVGWPGTRGRLGIFAVRELAIQIWRVVMQRRERAQAQRDSPQWYIALAGSRIGFLAAWKQDSLSMLASMVLAANNADILQDVPCARPYSNLAFVATLLRLERLERYYWRRAYAAAPSLTDRSHCLFVEGYARAGQGRWTEARALETEALRGFRAREDVQGEGNVRAVLGFIARSTGNYTEALHQASTLREGAQRYGIVEQETWSAVLSAATLLRLGRAEDALEHLERGEKMLQQVPEWVCELRVQAQWAHALLDLGYPLQQVEDSLQRATATMARMSGPPVIVSAVDGMASLAHTAIELWRAKMRDRAPAKVEKKRAQVAVVYLKKLARRFPAVRPYYQICRARLLALAGRQRYALRILEYAQHGAETLSLPFESALCDWHRSQWQSENDARLSLLRAQERFRGLGRPELREQVPG